MCRMAFEASQNVAVRAGESNIMACVRISPPLSSKGRRTDCESFFL
jgi:hypothetical protein